METEMADRDDHLGQGRLVAQCQDCDRVTTAIRTTDETLTVPGYDGCSTCGGSLTELDDLGDGKTEHSPAIDDYPLAGMLLRALVDADGALPQDELIATTGRSPYIVRDMIHKLDESGRINRVATNEGWQVRLAIPEHPNDVGPD